MKKLILALLLCCTSLRAAEPSTAMQRTLEPFGIKYQTTATHIGKNPVRLWVFLAIIDGNKWPLAVPEHATLDQIKSSYYSLYFFLAFVAGKQNPSETQQTEN